MVAFVELCVTQAGVWGSPFACSCLARFARGQPFAAVVKLFDGVLRYPVVRLSCSLSRREAADGFGCLMPARGLSVEFK